MTTTYKTPTVDDYRALVDASKAFGPKTREKIVELAFESGLGVDNEDPEKVFFPDDHMRDEGVYDGLHSLARIGFAERGQDKQGRQGVAVPASLLALIVEGLRLLLAMLSGKSLIPGGATKGKRSKHDESSSGYEL